MGVYYKQNGKWMDAVTPPAPPAVPRTWYDDDFVKTGTGGYIYYRIKPELRQYWIVGDTLQLRIRAWAGDHPEEYRPPIPGIKGEFDWMQYIDITGTIEASAVGLEVWEIFVPDNADWHYFRTADDKPILIKPAP